MRRICSLLALLGLVGMTVGCNHTAGACDCAGPGNACCYGSVGMPLAPTQWSPIAMKLQSPVQVSPYAGATRERASSISAEPRRSIEESTWQSKQEPAFVK